MCFYNSIAPYYDYIFPLEKDLHDMILFLVGNERMTLVDIGCATGNLALSMATKFNYIIGVDLERELINIANKKKKETGIENIYFMKADMRDIKTIVPTESTFVVLCAGNTIVHLDGFKEINNFIKSLSEVMVNGGKLLIQTINYGNTKLNGVQHFPVIENEKIIFTRKNEYLSNDKRINFKTCLTIKESGQTISNNVILYPLLKKEMENILLNNGFLNLKFYGSFDFKKYDDSSFLMIVFSEKSRTETF